MNQMMQLAKLGEDILSRVAEPVALKEISEIKHFVENMILTLSSFGNRIGLAAPQVYLSKRIVIYKIPLSTHSRYQLLQDQEEVPLTVMINPEWKPLTEEKIEGWEACISLPNLMGIVPRYKEIECTYLDLDGQKQTRIAKDFHARVIQHECDHLDGIVFTQQMRDLNSLTFEDVLLNKAI